MKDKMKILVIIVTYNAMRWAERCFRSLCESSTRPDVFVVDNGSTDGTQSYILEHYPTVIFHQSKENMGFGMANNIGLQYALDYNYPYVYLLNQDAWVMPDTFERLIEISQKNPDYGVLSPFQMNESKRCIDRDFLIQTMAWKSNPDIVNDIYSQQLKDVYPVMEVMAAHWFMTQKCILKVGGFSPSFYHYGEDSNYTDRVHYWNLKIGIVPSLKVVHDREWRDISDEKRMYLSYTAYIRIISNPMECAWKSHLKVLHYMFKHILMFKSLRPFFYSFKVAGKYGNIIYLKKTSMKKECAFLRS